MSRGHGSQLPRPPTLVGVVEHAAGNPADDALVVLHDGEGRVAVATVDGTVTVPSGDRIDHAPEGAEKLTGRGIVVLAMGVGLAVVGWDHVHGGVPAISPDRKRTRLKPSHAT